MNKKVRKTIVAILAVSIIIGCFSPTAALAATKKKATTTTIFKDVTSKTDYKSAIEWIFKKGGYAGIAKKNGNFKPYNVMTQREFDKTLQNLYGSRINIKAGGTGKLTQKYATKRLTTVSEQLGYRIKWTGGTASAKVTRSKAAYYIKLMINTGKGRLNP